MASGSPTTNNFEFLFRDTEYGRWLVNTAIVGIAVVAITLVLAVPAGYALARLKRGELLSPESSQRLLSIMSNTKTGPQRLKGGLQQGWHLSHKTGTGQVLGSVQAGYNDIGVITAPDGHSYALAVMIRRTSAPLVQRMQAMQATVRAVINYHGAIENGEDLAGYRGWYVLEQDEDLGPVAPTGGEGPLAAATRSVEYLRSLRGAR